MIPCSFDYLVALDDQGRIVTVNRAISQLLGLLPHDLVGTPWRHWLAGAEPEETMEPAAGTIRQQVRTAAGSLLTIDWDVLRTVAPQGQVLLACHRDANLPLPEQLLAGPRCCMSDVLPLLRADWQNPIDLGVAIERSFAALLGAKQGIMMLCHPHGEPFPANANHAVLPSRSSLDKITKILAACDASPDMAATEMIFPGHGSTAVVPLWQNASGWAAVYLAGAEPLPAKGDPAWLNSSVQIMRKLAYLLWRSVVQPGDAAHHRIDAPTPAEPCPESNLRLLGLSQEEWERFVESLSHDLRTPIVSLTGWTTILHDNFEEQLGPEGGVIVQRILRNLRKIDRVVNDLFSYARIASTRERPQFFTTRSLLERVMVNFQDTLKTRGITIEQPDQDIELSGERGRIQQVVSQLIDNAIRHMNRPLDGVIRIRVEDAGEFVRLSVADNGAGIAPQYHAKIFQMFQRLSVADPEGTGMGLALAKKIVTIHGGDLSLESTPGQGSTFTVTLPKRPALWDLPWDQPHEAPARE